MTKVEAIEKCLIDAGGAASLKDIYEYIEKYYPTAKKPRDWDAGLRGVLYRAIREEGWFKKLVLSIYALRDYTEEAKPDKTNIARMHSYIEGICIEIGNMKNFDT